VCGEFRAEDRWGGKAAFISFIFRDKLIDLRPIKLDHKVFCTDDTAAVVSELLGIDTSEGSIPNEQKISEDFRILSAALESYYQDNARYPKSDEGLAPLLASYAQHINTSSLLSSGDLEKLPLDPWQRPYLYEGPVFAGVKATPLLSTLGADGVAGGKGENADIKDVYMKYLDHIAKM
jgi:type II secretion system protein G